MSRRYGDSAKVLVTATATAEMSISELVPVTPEGGEEAVWQALLTLLPTLQDTWRKEMSSLVDPFKITVTVTRKMG